MQLSLSRDEFVATFERVVPGPYREAFAILDRQAPQDEWKPSPEDD